MYWTAAFKVTLHESDTNEVTRFSVSEDLEKVFLPLFWSEMIAITLNSNHMLQIIRKKPFCAKFELTFICIIIDQFLTDEGQSRQVYRLLCMSRQAIKV